MKAAKVQRFELLLTSEWLRSIIVIIIAILLAIGRHTYEGILLAVIAIALYFGGPGFIAKIAGTG